MSFYCKLQSCKSLWDNKKYIIIFPIRITIFITFFWRVFPKWLNGAFTVWYSIFFFPCFYLRQDLRLYRRKSFIFFPHLLPHWRALNSSNMHVFTSEPCFICCHKILMQLVHVFTEIIRSRHRFTVKNNATLKCAKHKTK